MKTAIYISSFILAAYLAATGLAKLGEKTVESLSEGSYANRVEVYANR